jgi:hypothetical protein
VLPEFLLLSLIIQSIAGTLLKHEQGDARQQNFYPGIVRLLPTVFPLSQLIKQVGKKMLDRLEQCVEDCLPAARLGGGSAPPGPALGLTFGGVACFPVLTALQGGGAAVLQQGLLWKWGILPLMIILQRRHVTSQRPQ